jgi:hypothetical protein
VVPTICECGLEVVEECLAGFGVEARRRLVEQEQAGLESENTGEADHRLDKEGSRGGCQRSPAAPSPTGGLPETVRKHFKT